MPTQLIQSPTASLPQWLVQEQLTNSFWDGQLLVDPEPSTDVANNEGDSSNPDTTNNKGDSSNPNTTNNKGDSESTNNSQETPDTTSEDSQETTGNENDSKPPKTDPKELIEALAALIADRKPKPFNDSPETTSDETTNSDSEAAGNEVDKVTQAAVRNLIIQQNKVPQELVGILPNDLGELTEFLQSDNYQKLAQALQPTPKDESPAPTTKDEPSGTDLDKAKPKTFDEITPEMLSAFDKLW